MISKGAKECDGYTSTSEETTFIVYFYIYDFLTTLLLQDTLL